MIYSVTKKSIENVKVIKNHFDNVYLHNVIRQDKTFRPKIIKIIKGKLKTQTENQKNDKSLLLDSKIGQIKVNNVLGQVKTSRPKIVKIYKAKLKTKSEDQEAI